MADLIRNSNCNAQFDSYLIQMQMADSQVPDYLCGVFVWHCEFYWHDHICLMSA